MTDWTAIMEDACRFFEQHLTDEHRAFLLARYGLKPWFVEKMRMGYAPTDHDALLMHLMNRGYSGDEIIGSGLVHRWDRDGSMGVTDQFRGRRVFPYLDGEGNPLYFIGRQTDETPPIWNKEREEYDKPPKYKKVKNTSNGPREPIFGTWSVIEGEPLIITEGITDALAVLQDCRPCISPVTTRFKEERIDEAAEYCRKAGPVYIINDNEESDAGLEGAVKTAYALQCHGIVQVYIGNLPRPEGVEKVDLNDYLRGGGDLDPILEAATPADEHPAVKEEQRKKIQAGVAALRSEVSRQRWQVSGKKNGDDIEDLKRRMPSLSTYTGTPTGGRGPHPVYGSTHGDNFAISADGETWTSFHGGNERGKSGNIFKLIALEQGFLDDEDAPLRGEAFKRTIEYCKERWG